MLAFDDCSPASTEAPSFLAVLAPGPAPAPAESAFLAQLHEVLAQRIREVSVDDAARALRTSSRTLQRRLRRAGTSFSAELTEARIRAGKERMRATDDKLTVIALEVGCASPQHFSTMFRKHTGMTPSEWRRTQRATLSAVRAGRDSVSRLPMTSLVIARPAFAKELAGEGALLSSAG
jgi:AraC-like DNA-binding protein